MVIIWGDTRSHIAEKCHTDIYMFRIALKLKLHSHVFASGKESGFFGIIVYTSNLNIAVGVH